MAKIRIHCSECGHEAKVPEAFRGKKVRCLRCHAKLRIPEDAPYEEIKSEKKIPKEEDEAAAAPTRTQRERRNRNDESGVKVRRPGGLEATRGGPSSKTRREAMALLRELLHDYDHALESVPRGFEIDLRGVAMGLARSLVEEMLSCAAIRDVKLAGGTGECRIVVSLQGYQFDPEDSFADDDEDTEVFLRGSKGGLPRGMLGDAFGLDDADDPVKQLDEDAPREPPPESAMQQIFSGKGEGATTRSGLDPMALFEQARTALEDGEPQAAIPLLEKAVKIDKNFGKAVAALGKAYASTGDYQRARRAFRHLTQLDKDDPEAHVLYAAAAVRCERFDEARAALKTAIGLDPEYQQAYRYAAQLYEKLGEHEKARAFRARYQALKLKG